MIPFGVGAVIFRKILVDVLPCFSLYVIVLIARKIPTQETINNV